jgi:hypothetical protein
MRNDIPPFHLPTHSLTRLSYMMYRFRSTTGRRQLIVQRVDVLFVSKEAVAVSVWRVDLPHRIHSAEKGCNTASFLGHEAESIRMT